MQAASSAPAQPQSSICLDSLAGSIAAAVVELCQGEEQLSRAQRAESDDRRTFLRAAAVRFRRAVLLPAATSIQMQALEALARVYDAEHLDEKSELEAALQALVTLAPDNLRYLFRLAKVQEEQERFDATEQTLLVARNRRPDEVEPYRQLAQFFARRSVALQGPPAPRSEATGKAAPDDNGIYRVSDALPPPQRLDVARYPEEAQTAGISGVVQAEITISEQGTVTDAMIVRSVPLLDEPALKAVRQWRFEPAIVDGKPVPVKMVVNVNFTLSK
jgi:TonB family protein